MRQRQGNATLETYIHFWAMKTVLIWVGKTNERYWQEAIEVYTQRLGHYTQFEVAEVADIKNAKNMTEEMLKQKEGEAILRLVNPDDSVVLLDDKGMEHTSKGFASWIEKQNQSGKRRLVFLIGGAYGFSDDVYARANAELSLSRMTYSHQMVRVVFLEQLYRAYTILNNEPYHHE